MFSIPEIEVIGNRVRNLITSRSCHHTHPEAPQSLLGQPFTRMKMVSLTSSGINSTRYLQRPPAINRRIFSARTPRRACIPFLGTLAPSSASHGTPIIKTFLVLAEGMGRFVSGISALQNPGMGIFSLPFSRSTMLRGMRTSESQGVASLKCNQYFLALPAFCIQRRSLTS